MKNSILLVEDDPVWRTMLTQFINHEPDMRVVHSVETKEKAILYCTHNPVDFVLMDLNLTHNQLDGIEATLELDAMEIHAKVVALTSFIDEQIILDAYTAGAIHYVSKSDFRKIPELIREMSKRFSPHEVLVKEYIKMKETEQLNKLTAAEKQIVQLLREGHTHKVIQRKLAKTESTLKNQITKILKKFNVKTAKEAVQAIKNRGLK